MSSLSSIFFFRCMPTSNNDGAWRFPNPISACFRHSLLKCDYSCACYGDGAGENETGYSSARAYRMETAPYSGFWCGVFCAYDSWFAPCGKKGRSRTISLAVRERCVCFAGTCLHQTLNCSKGGGCSYEKPLYFRRIDVTLLPLSFAEGVVQYRAHASIIRRRLSNRSLRR